MVIANAHAESQRYRSCGSKRPKDRQTDTTDFITFLANAVVN